MKDTNGLQLRKEVEQIEGYPTIFICLDMRVS